MVEGFRRTLVPVTSCVQEERACDELPIRVQSRAERLPLCANRSEFEQITADHVGCAHFPVRRPRSWPLKVPDLF